MIFNDTISIWNPFIKSLCSSTSAYYTGSKKKKFLPSWKVLLMSTVHNNFLDRLTITLPDRESVISIDKNIQNRLNSLRIIYYFNVCNWKSTLSTFKRINMYLCKSIVFNWISISSLFDYWNRSRKKNCHHYFRMLLSVRIYRSEYVNFIVDASTLSFPYYPIYMVNLSISSNTLPIHYFQFSWQTATLVQLPICETFSD